MKFFVIIFLLLSSAAFGAVTVPIPPGATGLVLDWSIPTAPPVIVTEPVVVTAPVPIPTKAFPGAEGYGAMTRGAYGGSVEPSIYHVTNLNDSGEGSFRDAFTFNKPMFVVFDVAGYINLKSELYINNPFVTIAGQTAPGAGICIRYRAIRIRTHDVIIRGLKVRNGTPGADGGNQDGIAIEAAGGAGGVQPYNIIVDHSTISWGSDETAVSWYACHHITWQYNLMYEGWNGQGHGYGLLAGDRSQKISIHHNLFALNKLRNPECNDGSSGEIINNVVYGWGNRGIDFTGTRETGGGFYQWEPLYWNVIGNYLKRGSGTGNSYGMQIYIPEGDGWGYYVPVGSKLYLKNNLDTIKNPTADPAKEWACVQFIGTKSDPNQFKSSVPALLPSGITTQTPTAAYEIVLTQAGAKRDTRDAYIIDAVRNSRGAMITTTPSWPTIGGSGENTYPLDPHKVDPVTGYRNIELYVNDLIK